MSDVALLDVNVIIALFDPNHVHHEAAHAWFAANRRSGWATCPLTQMGTIRVLSNPSYPGAERPAAVARRLRSFVAGPGHRFWPADLAPADGALFELGMTSGHRQITDVYLLGLAVHRDGRLATFDRIPMAAVPGARGRHLAVVGSG